MISDQHIIAYILNQVGLRTTGFLLEDNSATYNTLLLVFAQVQKTFAYGHYALESPDAA